MNKLLFLFFLYCLPTICFPQNFKPIPENQKKNELQGALSSSDKVPDIAFTNKINFGNNSNLYGIKKRLIILDFWNSSCSSCIDLFPHMQVLQKKFGDQVEIILVNGKSKLYHDDRNKIMNVLQKVKNRTG